MPKHHAINYVELMVKDIAAAKKFLGGAFDWQFNDYGPGPDYVGFHMGGDEMGGMYKGEPVRGGPLVVLYSDDLEATVSRVKEAGGEIVKEPFAFPGGRRFHFLDPSGNELAVWST